MKIIDIIEYSLIFSKKIFLEKKVEKKLRDFIAAFKAENIHLVVSSNFREKEYKNLKNYHSPRKISHIYQPHLKNENFKKKELHMNNINAMQHSFNEDGEVLGFSQNQTEAIFIAAVKKNPSKLLEIEHQTEAICLAAVKKYGWALKHVKNQTEAICLAAVKENHFVLKLVKNKTPKIMKAYEKSKEKYLRRAI